ncbi:Ig-like domain repeat protein [Streptomyces sp. NPDC002018]|uniref:Ig-like domain repeat protein n=1 Tax=Streptomyces sp. NPDC002018 TaxID=3364629 RepID=UPI003683AB19
MTRLARARTLPALLMCCALLLGAVAAVLGAAAGASAAGRLGDLTLGQTSGTILDNPLSPRVSTDAACPAGQGDLVRLSAVHPTDGTLAKIGEATTGGYDTAPVDTEMPASIFLFTFSRALTTWFGEGPYDGTYELRLDCVNFLDTTLPPAFFTTNIEVTGDTWALAQAETTSIALTASPENHPAQGTEVTFTATVTPAAAAGEITLTSERVGAEPVGLGTRTVENGSAVIRTSALTTGVQNIRAQFTPADPDAYAASSVALNGYTVDAAGPGPSGSPTPSGSGTPEEPADLHVVDADGDPLETNPHLEAGQKVTITARGYAADASVKVTLGDSADVFQNATADAEGTVSGYAFTVPEDIADGDHVLTLAEETADGHRVEFAFTTGEVADPTPEPSDSTGEDGGTSEGASGGSGGSGGDSGGTAGGGTDGGSSGGDDGGTGGGGSLASTGTGVAAIGLGSLALLLVGAALVIAVRRKGLLTFAAPSGTPAD